MKLSMHHARTLSSLRVQAVLNKVVEKFLTQNAHDFAESSWVNADVSHTTLDERKRIFEELNRHGYVPTMAEHNHVAVLSVRRDDARPRRV